MKFESPKVATMIFRSGKIVFSGAKSLELATVAFKTVLQALRKEGDEEIAKEPPLEIQNIVASTFLGGQVRLEEVARQLPKSMYEPEQFSGLIHRMVDPKSVILLSASGKLVCTGRKTVEDVQRAVRNLRSIQDEKGLIVFSA